MSLASINPTETRSWKSLEEHFQAIRDKKMQDMFSEDPGRTEQMSLEWKDLRLDYSKNRLTQETISLLTKLADEVKLDDAISKLFRGDTINKTEQRSVWHTELRNFNKMNPEVRALHQKMKEFSNAIIDGSWKGYTGRSITDIVNVRYLTGFTGTSGYLIITPEHALFVTDFRYQEQARDEVKGFRVTLKITFEVD